MAKVSNALRTIDFARRRRGLDPTEVSAFLRGIAEEVAVLEDVAADAEAVLNEIESHRAALESDIAEKDRLAAAERTSAYARAADTLRDAHHQAQAIVDAAERRASSVVPRPAATGGHTGLRRRASDAADAARLTSAALEAEAICAAARSEADKILAAADAQIALLSGSAQAEADQVIAAADAEAALASSLERAAANRSSDKVRADATAHAVTVSAASRAEADRLLAAATAEAAVVSSTAREASDRILEHARHEAAEHAATVSRAALAEADRILAAATAQAALLSKSASVPATEGGAPPSRPSERAPSTDHLADHLEGVGAWDGPGFDDLVDIRERLTDGIETLYATDDQSRGHWWSRTRP